jgi:vacuolar-type H+-ATPase subunit I/STV1
MNITEFTRNVIISLLKQMEVIIYRNWESQQTYLEMIIESIEQINACQKQTISSLQQENATIKKELAAYQKLLAKDYQEVVALLENVN